MHIPSETKLYVIRHGETEWNITNRLQGGLDSPLTKAGKKQTHALGKHLQGEPIDMLISSPLGRTRQTTEIICSYLPPIPVSFADTLQERSFGMFEGMTFAEIEEQFPALSPNTAEDRFLWLPPEGENWEHVCARVQSYIEYTAKIHAGKNIAIVCHLGIVKAILVTFGLLQRKDWFNVSIHNTSLSVIKIDGTGKATCDPCNSEKHLHERVRGED